MKFMDHYGWRKKNHKAFCCYVVDLLMANGTETNERKILEFGYVFLVWSECDVSCGKWLGVWSLGLMRYCEATHENGDGDGTLYG